MIRSLPAVAGNQRSEHVCVCQVARLSSTPSSSTGKPPPPLPPTTDQPLAGARRDCPQTLGSLLHQHAVGTRKCAGSEKPADRIAATPGGGHHVVQSIPGCKLTLTSTNCSFHLLQQTGDGGSMDTNCADRPGRLSSILSNWRPEPAAISLTVPSGLGLFARRRPHCPLEPGGHDGGLGWPGRSGGQRVPRSNSTRPLMRMHEHGPRMPRQLYDIKTSFAHRGNMTGEDTQR